VWYNEYNKHIYLYIAYYTLMMVVFTATTPLSFIHNPVLTDSVTHEIITIRFNMRVCLLPQSLDNIFLSFNAITDYKTI
jgi:hypothetical protein